MVKFYKLRCFQSTTRQVTEISGLETKWKVSIWKKLVLSSSQLLPCGYIDPILFGHQNFQEKMEIQNVAVIAPGF